MVKDCSDTSIIQNLMEGNTVAKERAWSCILSKCTDSLSSYLRNRGVVEAADREDIMYESIFRLIKIIESGFDMKKNVCAILMGVGKNVHHEFLRKKAKENKIEETYTAILDSLDDDPKDYSEFQKKFQKLGEKCKMLLDLKYVKGMKMSEMGEMLGRTSTGIKTDIQGCKNKLRAMTN